jgi:hypothetical protein
VDLDHFSPPPNRPCFIGQTRVLKNHFGCNGLHYGSGFGNNATALRIKTLKQNRLGEK